MRTPTMAALAAAMVMICAGAGGRTAAASTPLETVRAALRPIASDLDALHVDTEDHQKAARDRLFREIEPALLALYDTNPKVITKVGVAAEAQTARHGVSVADARDDAVDKARDLYQRVKRLREQMATQLNIPTERRPAGRREAWTRDVDDCKRMFHALVQAVDALDAAIDRAQADVRRRLSTADAEAEEHERAHKAKTAEVKAARHERDAVQALYEGLLDRFDQAVDRRDKRAVEDLRRQVAEAKQDVDEQEAEVVRLEREEGETADLVALKVAAKDALIAGGELWDAE